MLHFELVNTTQYDERTENTPVSIELVIDIATNVDEFSGHDEV